jgi:hypothetical protein
MISASVRKLNDYNKQQISTLVPQMEFAYSICHLTPSSGGTNSSSSLPFSKLQKQSHRILHSMLIYKTHNHSLQTLKAASFFCLKFRKRGDFCCTEILLRGLVLVNNIMSVLRLCFLWGWRWRLEPFIPAAPQRNCSFCAKLGKSVFHVWPSGERLRTPLWHRRGNKFLWSKGTVFYSLLQHWAG